MPAGLPGPVLPGEPCREVCRPSALCAATALTGLPLPAGLCAWLHAHRGRPVLGALRAVRVQRPLRQLPSRERPLLRELGGLLAAHGAAGFRGRLPAPSPCCRVPHRAACTTRRGISATSVHLASMGMPLLAHLRTASPAPARCCTQRTSECWGLWARGGERRGRPRAACCSCRFSRTCESLGGGGYRCTACAPGYTGQYCER